MNHKNKKAMENWSETKPDGWLLTEIEEKAALEAAGIVKQSRVDYLASLHPNLPKQSPELTDDEAMVALIRANKLKETQLEWNRIASERRKIEREAGEALLREWNYERFYREMKSKAWEVAKPEIREDGRFFIYNQNTAPLIKTICFKLSRDPRYETEMGFKFSNGLIIRGEYGAGKSFIPGLVAIKNDIASHAGEKPVLAIEQEILRSKNINPSSLSVLQSNDELMSPTISPGSQVLINTDDTEIHEGIYALEDRNGLVVLRHCRVIPGDNAVMLSTERDAEMNTKHLNNEEFKRYKVLGRVVSVVNWL